MKLFFKKHKEILVFISSPGDCEVQRRSACTLIDNANAHPDVVSQRLVFKPLLWENLPPGVAADGKFQRRINTMLKRLGYNEYGIYLGFMKGRVGTPTGAYDSGTVEELETSLSNQQKTGLPAEVLFYFIEPQASLQSEVSAFRQSLAPRHLLYTNVDERDFEEQLRQNLIEIFTTWNSWRMWRLRLRRRIGRIMLTGAVVLAVVVTASDLFIRSRITHALTENDSARATELWRDYSQLMLMSRRSVRGKINEQYVEKVHQTVDIHAKLDAYHKVTLQPTFDDAYFADMRVALKKEVSTSIEKALTRDPAENDVNLLIQAIDNGLFRGDGALAEELLESLAGVRLISALSKSRIPASLWKGTVLRPKEYNSVKKLAKSITTASAGLDTISDRQARTAIAFLADDVALLKTLASMAIKHDSFDQPEMRVLLDTVSPAVASEWLRHAELGNIPYPVLALIVDAVIEEREDMLSKLTLMELFVTEQIPREAFSLFETFSCGTSYCDATVVQKLIEWCSNADLDVDRLWLPLEFITPFSDMSEVSETDRSAVAVRLLELTADEVSTPGIIAALSILKLPAADHALAVKVQAHADHTISFGFSHRVALLSHLSTLPANPNHLRQARQIVSNSIEDQKLMQGTTLGGELLTSGVQGIDTAYLNVLDKNIHLADSVEMEVLSDILDRTVESSRQFGLSQFLPHLADYEALLRPLGHVLRQLTQNQFEDLLALPQPPLTDSPLSIQWARRAIMLQSVAVEGVLPQLKLDSLVEGLPDDEELQRELMNNVQIISPELAYQHYRERVAMGGFESVATLVDMGHYETLLKLLDDADFHGHPNWAEIMNNVIKGLLQQSQHQLLATIVKQHNTLVPQLMMYAEGLEERLPELDLHADNLLQMVVDPAADINTLLPAIGYVNRTGNLWAALTQSDSLPHWENWLASADSFSWVGLAQELENAPTAMPNEGAAFVDASPVLVVIDEPGNTNSTDQGWMVLAPENKVKNHLLHLSLASGQSSPLINSLSILWRKANADGVSLLGDVPNAAIVFRSYLTWIGAGVTWPDEQDCGSSLLYGLPQLDSTNPLVQRTASIFVITQGFRCSGYEDRLG